MDVVATGVRGLINHLEPALAYGGAMVVLAGNRLGLHNAANVHHLAARLGLGPRDQRLYKVAWVGGCVLFDVAKLRGAGGFDFWPRLPVPHAGEDVVAQLRVLAT